MFDEGKYVDTNYEVNLKNSIFLCTCNFMSEKEIKKVLGPAMYSRIGKCIEYNELQKEQKIEIINKWFEDILTFLDDDERQVIEETDILQWFKKNEERYDNIRLLKNKMEQAVYEKLAMTFVIEKV